MDDTRTIAFLDLGALHDELRPDLDRVWRSTVDDSAFIGGDLLDDFERHFADYCGRSHAIGVGNGTDALELALRALHVGPGDEVIVPANTFYATAEAVLLVGARPVYVDVDPRTLLVTPDIVEASITARTAAVIVVHLFGQPVDLDGFEALRRRHDVPVIEDAAQAHGASWNGRVAGSVGDLACFSFYPGKNLGALGDGGAVVTDDPDLARHVRSTANHGRDAEAGVPHARVGRNSRLDGLQAGFLDCKLSHLDRWNDARRARWDRYVDGFRDTPVRPVEVADEATSVHHLAVVRVPERDRVRALLQERGIATGIHYPVPCHRLPPFQTAPGGDPEAMCPVADWAAEEILSLPMYPQLPLDDVDHVIGAVLSAVDELAPARTEPTTTEVGS